MTVDKVKIRRRSLSSQVPSQDWTRWKKEIDGVRKFLKTLKGCMSTEGTRWRKGMKDYYTFRLQVLRESEPSKYIES